MDYISEEINGISHFRYMFEQGKEQQAQKKNVLIVGCKGMLGAYVREQFSKDAMRKDSIFNIVAGVDLPEVDIRSYVSVEGYLKDAIDFDVIVNCAACTDTTACEDQSHRTVAYAVNAVGAKNLAKACSEHCIKLIHVSTDYVWSEHSYDFDADEAIEFPVNGYGMQKLMGEKLIQDELAKTQYAILRTSWLYWQCNKPTFIHKLLLNCKKVAGQENAAVKATSDNFGKPTSAASACCFIREVIKNDACGIMDMQYLGTPMSRHEFAVHVLNAWKNATGTMMDVKVDAALSDDLPSKIQHPKMIKNAEGMPYETIPSMLENDAYIKLASNCRGMKDAHDAITEIHEFIKTYHFEIEKWLNEQK